MFTNVPAALKSADISRFAQRAAQLENVKPVIAYWCYYWILNQILSNRLQSANEECSTYAGNLMDKLEQMKAQHTSEDAINDDMTGQAYVEQFGRETFQRADNAVQANKASRQTAETFVAAATFLELLQIWASLTPEIASQIKYGKFHALRIVRAVKAGEDPNLSNPAPESPSGADQVQLDPEDPDVQRINGTMHQQPYIEEGDDTRENRLHDTNTSRPPLPDAPSDAYQVSPREPPRPPSNGTQSSQNPRQDSLRGGYFPAVSPVGGYPPSAPADPPSVAPSPLAPESDDAASAFYGSSLPDVQPQPPPNQLPPHTASRSFATPSQPPRNHPSAVLPTRQAVPQPQQNQGYDAKADDVAVAEAQKHARWAISALNFEDVGTAVKELRLALGRLGAV